jgi:hypothetical protein
VRRGRRRDVAQVERVLGGPSSPCFGRLYRRTASGLAGDVYVAEDDRGEIVGIVSVAYARFLMHGGLAAVLDGARARHEAPGPVLDGLVALAEERARRRGCRRLAAWVGAEDTPLRAALLARGYHPGEWLVADLGGRA